MIYEKYSNRIQETSINIVQTGIQSVRRKDILKTGIRTYSNGLIGVAGSLGQYDEENLKKQALEALKYGILYPFEVSKDRQETQDLTSEVIPEKNFIPEIEELLDFLKREHPDIIFSNKINLIEKEVALCNDQSLKLCYKDKYLEASLILKERSSLNILDGEVAFTGRKYDRHLFLEGIGKICRAVKKKVELPPGKRFPVIFSTGELLPLKKFITDLNGRLFGSSTSVFSNKTGVPVFNRNFTLYQTRHPEDNHLSFFDAEGIVNRDYRYPLIENGVVVTPYTDKKTARKYNLPLTGSAVSDYDGVPALEFTGFKVQDTGKTIKEIMGGRMGIWVIIALGGDFTPQGNFGTPVQLALLFDGENFVGRLPELGVSSTVFEMYGEAYLGTSIDSYFPLSNDKCLVMDMKVEKL